ncbi:MAG: hypothetical protein ABFD18_09085 [Syntrophomonas sp.]
MGALADHRERLPPAEETLRNMADFHDSAQGALAEAKLKQTQEMLVIKSVRELDIGIEHQRRQVKASQNDIEESARVFQETQNSILNIEIALQQSRVKLDEIKLYLDNNAVDSRLIENLAAAWSSLILMGVAKPCRISYPGR